VNPVTQIATEERRPARTIKRFLPFERLRDWSFARNVAILGGGTALAQGLNVLLAPVLTRLYLPISFGQYALFVSFLNFAMVGVSLRYELGIVAARTEKKAAQLALAAFMFSLPASLIGGGLLFSFIHFSLLGFNALPSYAPPLMFAILLLIGAFSALRYWFVREEQFGYISQAVVVQNGVRAFGQAAAGAMGGQLGGLLVGEVMGRSAGMSRMFRFAWPRIRAIAFPFDRRSFTEVLRENWQFPVYSLPSSLVDSAATNICIPLVVWYYGTSAGGYFSIVQRVLAVPLVLISASVADAFQARLALHARNAPNQIAQLFRRTSLGLLGIGLIPAALLFFHAEPSFRIVFGEKWTIAGKMAAIIAPYFLAQFVVSPLSRLVFVLEGQRLKLIYDVLALSGMIGVFIFSKWQSLPLMRALIILSAVGTFTFVVYYLLLMRIVSRFRFAADTDTPQ
jgi:lipopolysaccharide exporter